MRIFPVTIPTDLIGQKVQAYIFVLGSRTVAKSPSIYAIAQDTDLVVGQILQPKPVPTPLKSNEERAPQIVEISPKRVGHQIFAHVTTDQPAAIILSSFDRCNGEVCFGWQAMIAPPTDSSQLVTELDLPLLDVNVLPVPSEIRLTITTIDLAKRIATFSYRYDPATNILTPLD